MCLNMFNNVQPNVTRRKDNHLFPLFPSETILLQVCFSPFSSKIQTSSPCPKGRSRSVGAHQAHAFHILC